MISRKTKTKTKAFSHLLFCITSYLAYSFSGFLHIFFWFFRSSFYIPGTWALPVPDPLGLGVEIFIYFFRSLTPSPLLICSLSPAHVPQSPLIKLFSTNPFECHFLHAVTLKDTQALPTHGEAYLHIVIWWMVQSFRYLKVTFRCLHASGIHVFVLNQLYKALT